MRLESVGLPGVVALCRSANKRTDKWADRAGVALSVLPR